jgi:hypothetical protein
VPWFDDRDDMTGLAGAHFRIRPIHPGDGFRATRYGRLEGAGGHVGRAMRVVLKEGETREVRVRLPRR